MRTKTILHPSQIESSKEGYDNLWDQLEFGRFGSIKSGAAPTLYQEVIAQQGQRVFVIPQGSYTIGDHSLQVFVNGQLLRVGADNDYIEIDNRTIEFMFDLDQDDIVVFRVNGGTSGPSLHEEHIVEEGQTVIELAGSYTVGNKSLLVFVNGVLQALASDYIEDSPKRVIFVEPLEEDDFVILRVEGLPTVENRYQDETTETIYDTEGRVIRRETIGDTRVIKEYEYNAEGFPSRMITREGGFIITKTYVWENGRNVEIKQEVKERA